MYLFVYVFFSVRCCCFSKLLCLLPATRCRCRGAGWGEWRGWCQCFRSLTSGICQHSVHRSTNEVWWWWERCGLFFPLPIEVFFFKLFKKIKVSLCIQRQQHTRNSTDSSDISHSNYIFKPCPQHCTYTFQLFFVPSFYLRRSPQRGAVFQCRTALTLTLKTYWGRQRCSGWLRTHREKCPRSSCGRHTLPRHVRHHRGRSDAATGGWPEGGGGEVRTQAETRDKTRGCKDT